MKKKIIGGVSAFLLCAGIPSFAYAQNNEANNAAEDSYVSTVNELVRLNPGSTFEEMNSGIQETALSAGISAQQIANEALQEARISVNFAEDELRLSSGKKTLLPGGKGDIFYSPSSTGHVGIYYTNSIIVEAPGVGKKSHSAHRWNVKVNNGTEIMHVKTSQANRNKAANRAFNSYRFRDYNMKGFAFNKTANGKMNCSQLVWAAYKTTSGIDLDADGGHGVYPRDIKKSKWTQTYKTVR
ncbi:MAG: hypothetical protein J6M18_04660 [Actinomycetaceae bacterium]|nr:hypothetical protein [Actinomycetaceae bacterium]